MAKQAVLAIGEEIKTSGLPPEICPLIFVFTGAGNGTFTTTAELNSQCSSISEIVSEIV